MNVARLQTTPVFDWNFTSKARIRINQGGTSSGKTFAILQVIALSLIKDKKIATVVGQDLPNLKTGALRDFQERILPGSPWLWSFIESYNKTERVYRFTNGSILEFNSFGDEQDAKSGKRDIAFFNEANGIPFPIYRQIAMRTTDVIFIDYNPSGEFWVHEHVATQADAVTFFSNFTHNPFVDPSVVEYLRHLQKTDAEAWKVYGLGKTGSVTELVFERVTIVDEFPAISRLQGYGLDFGYRADPTALIRCGVVNGNEVYFDEIFFAYHMKTPDIDQRMKDENVNRSLTIWADAAEARVIDDLNGLRWNVYGADKGPGSVNYGINLLNSYKIHITERSLNMIAERKKYRHRTDKTGRLLNEPIDAFNHTWDSARYWAMMNLKPIGPFKTRHGVKKVN